MVCASGGAGVTSEVLVALLGLIGTLSGSFLGVIAANKLIQYRLKQLEDKVNKHNCLIERTYKLEGQVTELIHDVKHLQAFHPPKPN